MTNATLVCRNLWKLYGPEPERFMEKHGPSPSEAALKSAGQVTAVADASLTIERGEIFVIMGLSGSGKSTLVRCLSRLIEPTSGEVIFEGVDLLKASPEDLIELRRHKMGMVFQHFALLPHLSVLDNVAFPLEIRGVGRREREKPAREMIELVGLQGRENYLPYQLSGGQQQRVGIARSLITNPDVWFLDEPFSALDPLIRRELQDELMRLQARLHKTMVFVTHDFNEAVRLGDRIAIMKDGRVVQTGTPEEIVAEPTDSYVASFVAGVDQTRVISCGRIAAPARPFPYDVTVDGRKKIIEIASLVAGAHGPVGVKDASGQVTGEIDAATILRMMSVTAAERSAS